MSTTLRAQVAVVRQAGGPFHLEQAEVAPPRGDEVRVRMVATGMCHTDLVARDGFPVPLPIVLGHEGAGVVESVGPQVKRVRPGDHVVLSFNSCGSCPSCAQQAPAHCYQFMPLNFGGLRAPDNSSPMTQEGRILHGYFFGQSSFASYAVAREINTVVVDRDLPLELLGPLGCGLQTGAGAVMNSIALRAGQSLAVFGAGAVGLAGVMAAKALGASQIVVVEPNAGRRELAQRLGATLTIDPKTSADVLAELRERSGGGVNHAFDTTGIPVVIAVAVETMLPGGVLGLVGVSPMDAMLPANIMSLISRGVTIKAILEGDADPQTFIPQLLKLYREGRFPFDQLIGKFAFSQINEAAKASEDGSVIKPVLVF